MQFTKNNSISLYEFVLLFPSLFVLNDNFDISDHVLVLSTFKSTNVPMLINTNGEFSWVKGEWLNFLHIQSQSRAVSYRPNIFKCLKLSLVRVRIHFREIFRGENSPGNSCLLLRPGVVTKYPIDSLISNLITKH